MTRQTVDVTEWAKLNMWSQPDGELCVRPGLRGVFQPAGGTTIIAAFTVRNDFVDEVWHYVVTTGGGIKLLILDENFDTFLSFAWAPDGNVRAVSCSVVEGMMLFTSPDLPTLFGIVGSGVELAVKVASDNPVTSAIDIPRGISLAWCDRVVVADGRSLYFSDPVGADGGDVRTFVAENQNQRPGTIYGLHEGAGGMLIVITSKGTYGLDSAAAAVQVVGSNGTDWRLLSHIEAHSHLSSCEFRGRVFALTRDGYAPVDVEGTVEVALSDPTLPRATGQRLALDDFRRARMFALDEGPVVSCLELFAFHRSDLVKGVRSWWTNPWSTFPGDVRGVLRDQDGTQMLAMADGVYRVAGDFDSTSTALSTAGSQADVAGAVYGTIPGSPTQNRLVKHVSVAAAVDGALVLGASLRGSLHQGTPDADPQGLTVGTTAWGDTTRRWTTTPIAGARIDFGDPIAECAPTRDLGIEITMTGAGVRFAPAVDVDFSESAVDRPQKVA